MLRPSAETNSATPVCMRGHSSIGRLSPSKFSPTFISRLTSSIHPTTSLAARNISFLPVILADYDDYRDFLQKQTQRFKLVFLILGNHEFYNGSFAWGLQKARQLEREPSFNGRLIVLHRGRYNLPGSRVTILGCTLWSKVPHESRDIVQSTIKDFQKIEGWTIDDHNASHDSDLAWLLSEIQSIQQENERATSQSQKQSILVVTHHAPSLQGTSSPKHAQNPWNSAFGTDILSQLSTLNEIKIWVFGHTHYTTDFREKRVRLVSNQRGYVLPWNDSTSSKDGFDVRKVVHV